MISNPKNGWCDFELGDFHGRPSDSTNVAIDLLETLRNYKYNGQGMAWFDEEGTEFSLVLTPYSLFIIEECGDIAALHDLSDVKGNIIDEVISDVESDLYEWSRFGVFDNDEEEIKINRDMIRDLIAQIKDYK